MWDETSAQCHPCKVQSIRETYLCVRAEDTKKKDHLLWTCTLGMYLEIPEILVVVPLQLYNSLWLSLQSDFHALSLVSSLNVNYYISQMASMPDTRRFEYGHSSS